MKCSKAKELLSAELDGELTSSEELALTRHLAACAECTQEKAELSSLRGEMSLWADEEPSEWLAQSFSFKLKEIMSENQVKAPKPARWRWNVFGPATAGVVTAALLGVMLLHNQQQPIPVQKTTVKAPAPAVATTPPADKLDVKPSQPAVATNPKPAVEPMETVQPTPTAPKPAVIRQEPRHVAVRPVRTPSHPVTVAVRPSAPTYSTKSVPQPAVSAGPADSHFSELSSRGASAPYAAPRATAEVTIVGSTKQSDAEAVKEDIGEAGLAMNENVEKLRGKLQEAVDLLVSKPPLPVKAVTDPNGGSNP